MNFGIGILFTLLIFSTVITESAKILAVFSLPSPSHYIFALPVLKELAARGHEVTSIGVYPLKEPVSNFRDIFVHKNAVLLKDILNDAAKAKTKTGFESLASYMNIGEHMCINVFSNSEVQELMKSPDGKFDLIIAEILFSESLSGLGQHFNAPMIAVSPFGAMITLDDAVGNASPASINPSIFLPYSSKMTFFERIINLIELAKIWIPINYKNYYRQREIYEKYFPDAKLSFDEAKKDFSLLIVNQHHTLSYPRPYVTNVIEAGGLHIPHNPAPLPKDIQQFLDNATEGAIYFSMGSNVKSKSLPVEKREIFMNVFRGLKQKILWKFEDNELPGKPDNVFISPWLAQHSVLAHPNVKVFMTHGGLLSTTESIFYGKPILGIPMFAEQPRNVAFAVNRGIALSVDFKTLNELELKQKLLQLLYNPSYNDKMKLISSQYHDQPMTALETAMFWIEYVLRHKGAKHLRNAGTDLNLWQYYSLDVVGFIFSGLVIVVFLVIFLVRKLWKIFNVKSQPVIKSKRN